MSPPYLLALAAATTALAAGLARVAPALGWLDRPGPPRKLQRRPVAPVGGAALLLVGGALLLVRGRALDGPAPDGLAGWVHPAGLLWGGLAAFAVGLVDDLRPAGLRPGAKLAGQLVAGAAFAAPTAVRLADAGESLFAVAGFAALALAAVAAMNAVNTFDNSDGAATALGALGLAAPAPALAAALAGLLPLHLARPGRPPGDRRARLPQVYLGDAGSHLLAVALLAFPAAWPALALPALDLARVVRARLRAGQAPWVGDRRHLAHRLAARGLGRGAVVALLLAVAAPSALLGARGVAAAQPGLVALGVAATAALHALAWSLPPRQRSLARGRALADGEGAAGW